MDPAEPLFPVFLKLSDRRVVVVGGGPIAATKLSGLLSAGARVTVVSPEVSPAIPSDRVTLKQRKFQSGDLDNAWLTVAAAPPPVNREVALAAESRCLFVNAVDDPPNATAYLGGVIRRAGVTVAISTDGKAPGLASLIRQALDVLLPEEEVKRWLSVAKEQRARWIDQGIPIHQRRPLLLRALENLYQDR